MLRLHGHVRTRTIRCLWALEELEVPYEYIQLKIMDKEHKTPEFLKKHPGGKVPVLEDGALTLFESAAICTYLGEKYPERGFVPKAGTFERAHYDKWLFFATTELDAPLWGIAKHSYLLPEEKRIKEAIVLYQEDFKVAAATLSTALGDCTYILGDSFTLADIVVGHTLFWGMSSKLNIEQENLKQYIGRLKARPAFDRVRTKIKEYAAAR